MGAGKEEEGEEEDRHIYMRAEEIDEFDTYPEFGMISSSTLRIIVCIN